jgi:hypothetical protein
MTSDDHPNLVLEQAVDVAVVGRDEESGDHFVAARNPQESAASSGRPSLPGVRTQLASFGLSTTAAPNLDEVIVWVIAAAYVLGLIILFAYFITEHLKTEIENPYIRHLVSAFLSSSGLAFFTWMSVRAMTCSCYPDTPAAGVCFASARMCTSEDLDSLHGVFADHPANLVSADWRCSICLGDIQDSDGEQLRELVFCKHIFHRECIDQWLLSKPFHSLNCPLCRGPVSESQIGAGLKSESTETTIL